MPLFFPFTTAAIVCTVFGVYYGLIIHFFGLPGLTSPEVEGCIDGPIVPDTGIQALVYFVAFFFVLIALLAIYCGKVPSSRIKATIFHLGILNLLALLLTLAIIFRAVLLPLPLCYLLLALFEMQCDLLFPNKQVFNPLGLSLIFVCGSYGSMFVRHRLLGAIGFIWVFLFSGALLVSTLEERGCLRAVLFCHLFLFYFIFSPEPSQNDLPPSSLLTANSMNAGFLSSPSLCFLFLVISLGPIILFKLRFSPRRPSSKIA